MAVLARWLFLRGSVTVEVYVSSIRTRAFGRYIEGGCCSGVAVKRGSTVQSRNVIPSYNYDDNQCYLILRIEGSYTYIGRCDDSSVRVMKVTVLAFSELGEVSPVLYWIIRPDKHVDNGTIIIHLYSQALLHNCKYFHTPSHE